MTYIENIFVCIAAPLLVAAFCMGKKYYRFYFFAFAGMAACLLSAYINTFFARLYNADLINATTQIAPVVEEIIKLLPLLFYLLVFEPKAEKINAAVLIVPPASPFENICYLTKTAQSSSPSCLCAFRNGRHAHRQRGNVGYGLTYVWQHGWPKIAGTAAFSALPSLFMRFIIC